MYYNLLGGENNPIAEVFLQQNEKIRLERGAMVFMKDVQIQGKLNSRKGGLGSLFSAVGRSITGGESMFITEAQAISPNGVIGIAPALPGVIECLHVSGEKQYCLNTGAYLASDYSVNYRMVSQSFSKAMFAGTGGFFIMETEGEGDLLVNAYGNIVALTLNNSEMSVDNANVVAWDRNLDYSIKVASGLFGYTTGEGLVNQFHGTGKILVQTRNLSDLAHAISPYIPKTSSN